MKTYVVGTHQRHFTEASNYYQQHMFSWRNKILIVVVLWPSDPIRVMLSVVSLPNHTFPGQA